LKTILQDIYNWFLVKKEYLNEFANVDSRLENWFKGEMVLLLSRLKLKGIVKDFQTERPYKVDLLLTLTDRECLCELKAFCISQIRGKNRKLSFYFGKTKGGFRGAFEKLDKLPKKYNKYVIGFIYPNPGKKDWVNEITNLPSNLKY